MSILKEMDPRVALKAIEGYKDVLTPEANELDKLYQSKRCPRCLGGLQKEFDSRFTFADEDVSIGRALLRCPTCNYLVDPHNNIVVEYGNPAEIPVESIPIIDPNKP